MAILAPPMPPGVDSGRPAPRYHNGTLKRLAPVMAVRRAVALRYGATPGLDGRQPAMCQYCLAPGFIWWPPRLNDGKPGAFVKFIDLSLDHVVPYSRGGCNQSPDNFVLACGPCNASKGFRPLAEWAGRP